MKKEKILLIIPAYNESEGIVDVVAQVAAYCQKSPYHIDYLVINDGSTDKTQQILEEFQKKYTNIILENQENFGEAISRNKAIFLSKGEYITFLDSDDYYDALTLSKALQIIASQNLDILYLKMNHISEDYQFIQSLPNLSPVTP